MKERGFTTIEIAVLLAVMAVIAAVITPIVTSYIDQERVVRATGDLKTIAHAIRLFYKDTGEYPIYTTAAQAIAGGTPPAQELVGPGNPPGTVASWSTHTSTIDLVRQLNQNFLGRGAYRGPYIGALDTDPWGNQYIVTADNLTPESTNWAIVISAGPNGTLDTNPNQPNTSPFSVTGDDIVAIIK